MAWLEQQMRVHSLSCCDMFGNQQISKIQPYHHQQQLTDNTYGALGFNNDNTRPTNINHNVESGCSYKVYMYHMYIYNIYIYIYIYIYIDMYTHTQGLA